MSNANKDIKAYAKRKGVYLWQVADKLGISANTMSVKLRKPFTAKQRAEYFTIVDDLALANAQDDESSLFKG